ncbi:Tat (twin-arginine translocation) pathway signal sequence containing protein [Robertkochia solimangrovi]|nr:Tat (twin-arginine translocation) pathway signal sequence containing protein [Robertkochia solimangrovi]
MNSDQNNSRRNFMSALVMGAAAGSLSMLSNPVYASNFAKLDSDVSMSDVDEWFKQVKGTHRAVFDGSMPHKGFPVLWTFAFYATNNANGTPDEDMTAVCVLRHNAIPFAMDDGLWSQYKLGEAFEINDMSTGKPAMRNVVYEPTDSDFPVPGVDGIKKLQERGAMFCVCDLALKVYSGFTAAKLGMDAAKVYDEWKSGILPGIQIVPSGVLALGRAQEHNCGYIFAGE